MSIFIKTQEGERKRIERETQEKIKVVESHAYEVLRLLASKELDLNATALVLKVTNDILNKKGSRYMAFPSFP